MSFFPSANMRYRPSCLTTQTSSTHDFVKIGLDGKRDQWTPSAESRESEVAIAASGRRCSPCTRGGNAVVAEDVPALADLAVPGVAAGPLEHGILGGGLPVDERPGGVVGSDGPRPDHEQADDDRQSIPRAPWA